MSTETITAGSVHESGTMGNRRWWVVDSIAATGFVRLTRLEWSDDLVNEAGVMFRTDETIRFKSKGERYLYSAKIGGFIPARDQITVKERESLQSRERRG